MGAGLSGAGLPLTPALDSFIDEAGRRYLARAEIGRGVLTTVCAADQIVAPGEPPAAIPRVALKTILPLWVGHPLAEARIARERELSAELHDKAEQPLPSCAHILAGGRQLLPGPPELTRSSEARAAHEGPAPQGGRVVQEGRSRPFHVSPLYDGMTLADRLRHATRAPAAPSHQLPPRLVLAWAAELLTALARLHGLGWVHRDIKPQNIFLVAPSPQASGLTDVHAEPRARAVLIDYGLAMRIASTADRGDEPFGTPAYVSPEVVAGAPLDGRADVYSLGLVLFELLARQRPFPNRDPIELVEAHLSLRAPLLRSLRPELSVELERVIAATLAKSPGERPATVEALAALLRATPEARVS